MQILCVFFKKGSSILTTSIVGFTLKDENDLDRRVWMLFDI